MGKKKRQYANIKNTNSPRQNIPILIAKLTRNKRSDHSNCDVNTGHRSGPITGSGAITQQAIKPKKNLARDIISGLTLLKGKYNVAPGRGNPEMECALACITGFRAMSCEPAYGLAPTLAQLAHRLKNGQPHLVAKTFVCAA